MIILVVVAFFAFLFWLGMVAGALHFWYKARKVKKAEKLALAKVAEEGARAERLRAVNLGHG